MNRLVADSRRERAHLTKQRREAKQARTQAYLEHRVDRMIARRAVELDAWSLRMSVAAEDFGRVLTLLNDAGPDQLKAAVLELLISDPLCSSVDAVLGAVRAPSSISETISSARTFDHP